MVLSSVIVSYVLVLLFFMILLRIFQKSCDFGPPCFIMVFTLFSMLSFCMFSRWFFSCFCAWRYWFRCCCFEW